MSSIDAIRTAAVRWQDDDYEARERAARAVVEEGLFSEPQIAFALNEQMSALAQLDEGTLHESEGLHVVVRTEDVQPLSGLAEALAFIEKGWAVHLPEVHATLTRAFLADAGIDVRVSVDAGHLFVGFSRDTMSPAYPCYVAVLDGKENAEACEGLAEDVLLYDGASQRCVRLVMAPRGLSPDRYLEAFAEFRGRVPAPARLRAQVRMMEAFARKAGVPHAALDDDSLLVTRGEAEPQRPGHLRWVEYETVDEVRGLVEPLYGRLLARGGFDRVGATVQLGDAHRPGTARFLEARERVAVWLDQESR